MLGPWGPSLEDRRMLNQVSPRVFHWTSVSFRIKQLAQILFTGNLSAFCISVRLCVWSSTAFSLKKRRFVSVFFRCEAKSALTLLDLTLVSVVGCGNRDALRA